MLNIIKYQNRKLYLKDESRYISISELIKLTHLDEVSVLDKETNKDVTIPVLFGAVGQLGKFPLGFQRTHGPSLMNLLKNLLEKGETNE